MSEGIVDCQIPGFLHWLNNTVVQTVITRLPFTCTTTLAKIVMSHKQTWSTHSSTYNELLWQKFHKIYSLSTALIILFALCAKFQPCSFSHLSHDTFHCDLLVFWITLLINLIWRSKWKFILKNRNATKLVVLQMWA